MDAPLDPRLRSNPFATRYTRPGALAFLFPPGQSPPMIVAALRQAGWWGQIVGPHGSGKSTLLAALLPELTAQGRQIVSIVLSQGERRLPVAAADVRRWTGQTQLIVDGYEQLSWWNRRKVQNLCRRAGAGLLITAHEPCGLATVFQTAPSLELAQSIVQALLPAQDSAVSHEDVAQAYRQHPTNLREVLFRLYDLYQSRHS